MREIRIANSSYSGSAHPGLSSLFKNHLLVALKQKFLKWMQTQKLDGSISPPNRFHDSIKPITDRMVLSDQKIDFTTLSQ